MPAKTVMINGEVRKVFSVEIKGKKFSILRQEIIPPPHPTEGILEVGDPINAFLIKNEEDRLEAMKQVCLQSLNKLIEDFRRHALSIEYRFIDFLLNARKRKGLENIKNGHNYECTKAYYAFFETLHFELKSYTAKQLKERYNLQ